MTKCLSSELRRAFFSKRFIFSLIIGLSLCVAYFIEYNLKYMIDMSLIDPDNNFGIIPNPFKLWIGGELLSWQSFCFFMILPVLASLPFADSFYTDVSTGTIKNILIRCKRQYYLIAKLIAVFLSAGVAVVLPLLVSFGLACATLPAHIPILSTCLYPIGPKSMWIEMYYSNPFLYVFLYLIIIFVFSGLLAQIALWFSYFLRLKLAVVISPFMCYLFAYVVLNTLGIVQYSPFNFLPPCQPVFDISFNVIVIEGVFLLFLNAIIFITKGHKADVL